MVNAGEIRNTVFMPVSTRFVFQGHPPPLTFSLAACKQLFELLYGFIMSLRLKLSFSVSSTTIPLCATPLPSSCVESLRNSKPGFSHASFHFREMHALFFLALLPV